MGELLPGASRDPVPGCKIAEKTGDFGLCLVVGPAAVRAAMTRAVAVISGRDKQTANGKRTAPLQDIGQMQRPVRGGRAQATSPSVIATPGSGRSSRRRRRRRPLRPWHRRGRPDAPRGPAVSPWRATRSAARWSREACAAADGQVAGAVVAGKAKVGQHQIDRFFGKGAVGRPLAADHADLRHRARAGGAPHARARCAR